VDGKWLIKKLFCTLLITVACCVLACKCTLTCCSLVPFHSFLPSAPSITMSGNIPYRMMMMMMVMTAFGECSVSVGILDDRTLKQMSYCLHVE
jgi:hypothetical protein